jgi:hypothetical protein
MATAEVEPAAGLSPALAEFLAAPAEAQDAFFTEVKAHAEAQHEFDQWTAAVESDDPGPAEMRGPDLPRDPPQFHPPRAARATPRSKGRAGAGDDPLGSISPPDYFAVLTGAGVPATGGMVRCPVHEDHEPSCMVYASAERGWHCYGCSRGGSIYDLASALSGIGTRGDDFLELRRWIARRFLHDLKRAA